MKFPNQFRWQEGPNAMFRSNDGDPFGMFIVPGDSACGRRLKIIATDGDATDWEHVSVSLPDWEKRMPSWAEMCKVKELFWDDTQCVVEFHPEKSDHISYGEVAHLWRWKKGEFPMPPKICV